MRPTHWLISTQVEAAAQAAAEPGVQVATVDGDVVAFARKLADEAWLERLEPAAGPKSATHLVVAELADRFGSRHVLGNKADEFVEWLGPDAVLVLQFSRAFSCDDCDYLLRCLLPAGEQQYGRRSQRLLLAIHEAYCAARPRDEAPLGVAAFIEHVAAPVVAKLCAERRCILEQQPDAPYSYVFAAVCAFLTLLAQPLRRFEREMADVGCVKSRVSSAEYASYLAFFPDALALPSTLEELFMTTLRPTIAEDSPTWTTKTITYKGDDGIVQVLDPDAPLAPTFAIDFVGECGAIREAIRRGQAPLDAIRDASAAFADVCLIFDVRSSATASALRLEILDNYGSRAWRAVRYFTDGSDASLQHETQRLAELGFDAWIDAQLSSLREAASVDVDAALKLATCRFGRDRGPLKRLAEGDDAEKARAAGVALEALRRAGRIYISETRRSAVLARRAASDPDDDYVRMADDHGLWTALEALAAGTDEEDARAARAELEALPRRGQGVPFVGDCAVLARRAASDPDDAYVRMARTDGLLTALTALAAGTDEEDAREAWAELDVLRRTRHGLGGTHAPLFPAPDACDVVAELEVRIINLELENAYFKSKLAVPVVRSKFAVAPPFTPIPTFSQWSLPLAAHALANLSVNAANQVKMADQGGIAMLVDLLESSNEHVQRQASKARAKPSRRARARRALSLG